MNVEVNYSYVPSVETPDVAFQLFDSSGRHCRHHRHRQRELQLHHHHHHHTTRGNISHHRRRVERRTRRELRRTDSSRQLFVYSVTVFAFRARLASRRAGADKGPRTMSVAPPLLVQRGIKNCVNVFTQITVTRALTSIQLIFAIYAVVFAVPRCVVTRNVVWHLSTVAVSVAVTKATRHSYFTSFT